jgi:hypothetical protein
MSVDASIIFFSLSILFDIYMDVGTMFFSACTQLEFYIEVNTGKIEAAASSSDLHSIYLSRDLLRNY